MYGNPYTPNAYNPQLSIDRINAQISELEKMKQQIPQQPIQPQMPMQQPITQNFQIAPTNREVIRYASSIDEVQRDMVIGDTPYFSKDLSVVWIKNTKGDIKTYELNEIIAKDERDLMIESLQMEINELKGKINNEPNVANDNAKYDESSTTKDDEPIRTTIEENKPSSIPRISNSKKK